MFKDPYATTPCLAYSSKSIANELQRYIAIYGTGSGQVKMYGNGQYQAYVLVPGLAKIPPFAHALEIPERQGAYVMDMRGFTRMNQFGEPVTVSPMNYDVAILRLSLQVLWAADDALPTNLLNTGSLQITVFSRWLASLLHTRFSLTPDIQMRATVLSAFYYLCLFNEHPDAPVVPGDRLKLAGQIARATYISAPEVISVIESLPVVSTLQGFIDLLKEHGNSVRFEELNLALFYELVGWSWFGANSRELVAVALEHPPTFVALVYSALTERGFRNTGLGKIALQNDRGDLGHAFTNGVRTLVGNLTR